MIGIWRDLVSFDCGGGALGCAWILRLFDMVFTEADIGG